MKSLARRMAAVAAVGLLSTMAAGPVPADAAPEPAASPVRYIVMMTDGTPTATVMMTAEQARRRSADPAVALVEPDRKVSIEATQTNPDWGLDRIDQRTDALSNTFTPTDDGSSVHAYVIDTGIRITHQQFGGRASYGYDFVGNDKTASDCNGHGTHVAGTIGGSTYGVAKKVKLVAVRVLDCTGSGYVSDIIRGVDWVTKHAVHPAVANMSIGGDPDPALNRAVAASISSGITYTVAAGNDDEDASNDSPANLAAAITVGASDWTDTRSSFSNYGSLVDIFAPGEDITSAWDTSNTATAEESGTSMAAPHVAGAAALALDAYPAWSPATVRTFLVDHSTKNALSDVAGSPNRLLYTPQPPATPVIKTTTLKTGKIGQTYAVQLALSSSRRGTWTLVGGTLPSGLRLSAAGVLSGQPRATASRRITVRFTDFVPRSATRTLTLSVKR